VLFAENLADRGRAARQADGVDWLQALAEPFTPEATAVHTGIEAASVRALARDLARTPRAAIYGRFGTSVGRNATLTTYLIDAVNLVAGNLDRPGGSVFSGLEMPGQKWGTKVMGVALRRTYEKRRSRIGGFRATIGSEPAALMAKEIATPGERRIRALFVSAGNPVLSVPNGNELEQALDGLDLSVVLDFYITETTAHCDYVLPVTTMYERDDFPVTFQTFQATPFRQATEAVVAPAGQARTEWEIIDDLMQRMATGTPVFTVMSGARKLLSLFGVRLRPRLMFDAMIRLAAGGNRFGLRRGGLTFRRLTQQHPHGVVLAPHLRTDVLDDVVCLSARPDSAGAR
jgi:anaerobic selenocysteine-containing dehydrogenase